MDEGGKKIFDFSIQDASLEVISTRFFDNLLTQAKSRLTEDFFNSNVQFLSKYGVLALYVTAVAGFIIGFIAAIKFNSFADFAIGLGWAALCLVIQYIAVKFLPAIRTIIESTPSKLSSDAFLKSFSLICFLLGIFSFISLLVIAIKTDNLNTFFVGSGCLIIFEYLVNLGLNPRLLNIEIVKNTSAGEEAIGILSFMMKGNLRLVPIIFGSGIIISTLSLIISSFKLFSYYPQAALGSIIAAGSAVLVIAILPFLAFLIFIFYYLAIDVISSIIEIPKKLK